MRPRDEPTETWTAWAAARLAWWRVPVLAWLALVAVGHLRDRDGSYGSLVGGFLFGAHEFGHLVFFIFGETLGLLGGSLMQLLVPLGALALMWRAGDWFGMACTACLMAASHGHLAVYIADARALQLDLVSFTPDGGGHDWAELLSAWGLLRQDLAIARLVRGLGWLWWAAGVGGGLWLLTRMRWRLSAPQAPPS
jgi:hypothetical protein